MGLEGAVAVAQQHAHARGVVGGDGTVKFWIPGGSSVPMLTADHLDALTHKAHEIRFCLERPINAGRTDFESTIVNILDLEHAGEMARDLLAIFDPDAFGA